jgi:hypothetical protein
MPDVAPIVNIADAAEKKRTNLVPDDIERERIRLEKIQFQLMAAQEKKWAQEEKDKRRLELFERQEQARKEKQATREANRAAEAEKLTIGEIEADLVKFLSAEPIYTSPGIHLPPFPHDIRVHKPDSSDEVLLYRVEKNTAYPLGKMSAISMLHKYMGELPENAAVYNAGQACSKRVMESFIYGEHKNNELPHHWGTADYSGLCFNRQDFDLTSCTWDELNKAHPIITQMLDRLSNPDVVADWLGALLTPGSYRKQALYLWGQPNGGKSQYALMLKCFFGPAYRALSNKDLNDPFWRGDIEKCRAVVFKEANSDFINSDEYKDLTGDVDQRINRKFRDARQAVIDTMLLFLSNNRPVLTGDEGAVDRLLMSEVSSIPKDARLPEEEVKRLMEAAKGHAGGYFRNRYLERYPNKGKIDDTNTTEVRSCITSKYPTRFEEIFEGNFEVQEGAYTLGLDFTTRLQTYGIFGKDDPRFRAYVTEKYGPTVEYKKSRIISGESPKHLWANLLIKPRPFNSI